MADAAAEWGRRAGPSWLIAPTPRKPFYSAWGRPLTRTLLSPGGATNATLVSPRVDYVFELGTAEYRSQCYARAARENVPAGVPLVVSDDPDVWRAAALLADRNPMIGVMHADDKAYYELARGYCDALAGLVCVSSRIERAARSLLPGPAAPTITRIPCGVPLPPLGPSRPPDARLRISWAGRMEEKQKRVSDLVRILTCACDSGIDATLDVLGDGPERRDVEQAAAAAGVRSRITFHGWQPVATVMRTLGASDVFLMTSNFEGMPITIMEALGLGCAVVSTSVSGVEDYENSRLAADALWTFPIGDVEAAVARLREVMAVPSISRRLAARKLAEAEFSIGTCINRYESLLSSLPDVRPLGRAIGSRRTVASSFLGASVAAIARRMRLHLQGNVSGRYAGAV